MTRTVFIATLMIASAAPAIAGQAQDPAQSNPPATQASQTAAPSDRAVDPSEPDFTLIGLPTTLRMPNSPVRSA